MFYLIARKQLRENYPPDVVVELYDVIAGWIS